LLGYAFIELERCFFVIAQACDCCTVFRSQPFLKSPAPAPVTAAVAPPPSFASLAPPPAAAPSLVSRIEQFYLANAPDKVSHAAKLAEKYKEAIWDSLEQKYPTKTAPFRLVRFSYCLV
jgi:hypothetical protein